MGKRELLFTNPVFKETIWGGNRLREDFGYPIPSDLTGECWAISAHENGDCTILNGDNKGKTLSELWITNRELFGHMEGDKFPLLIKIIDAKDDLSIQVHPDDSYAKQWENGSFGKTECWYILDCEPDSHIVIGHNARTKEEAEDMIGKKEWDKLIRKIPIKKGDFFQIDPGCIHAICKGTILLETQQNSDITYRLYDYDRLSDGELRELHIDKSLDVMTIPFTPSNTEGKVEEYSNYKVEELYSCEYYTVSKLDIDGSAELTMKESFLNISVIDGEGTIDGIQIKKGSHFIIPFGYGDYRMEGKLSMIISSPAK